LPRRTPSYWNTPLGRWIDSYGVSKLLSDLHAAGEPIHITAIYGWISGRRYVSPPIALKLVQLGAGQISLDVIYGQRNALRAAEKPESERT